MKKDPHIKVTKAICDMVERHYLKGLACIAAAYGCEFCLARASTKGKGVQWLYPETAEKPERNADDMKALAR